MWPFCLRRLQWPLQAGPFHVRRAEKKSLRSQAFWQELKEAVSKKGSNDKLLYWDFVGADSYEETIQRAFLTSFLITYGYATLAIYPLEEQTFIKPFEKPLARIGTQQSVSIPIAVSHESWHKWKRGELD